VPACPVTRARTRTVPVAGAALRVLERGEPGAPAVVLLHGGSSSAATWDRLAAALAAAGRYVIAADLRGHGGSARCAGYPLGGYADDASGLMDALGTGPAALAGHSLGGYAAALLAQREPDRVTRLVLEEPGMPPREAGGGHGRRGPRFALPALAALAVRRGFDPKAVTAAVRQLRVPDPGWWDRLGLITAPTLLVSGGPASHIPARQMAQAARAIPGARLVTIPAGHRVHSRRPREFLAAVLPFLAGAQAEGG